MIKGYCIPDGYMGLVNSKYMLFASESDYLEYLEQEDQDDNDDEELERII